MSTPSSKRTYGGQGQNQAVRTFDEIGFAAAIDEITHHQQLDLFSPDKLGHRYRFQGGPDYRCRQRLCGPLAGEDQLQ